jgi:hypothetical protein
MVFSLLRATYYGLHASSDRDGSESTFLELVGGNLASAIGAGLDIESVFEAVLAEPGMGLFGLERILGE